MTDNEIVNALECCKRAKLYKDCLDLKCPFATEYGCNIDAEDLRNEALDLINRQKAEIDDLIRGDLPRCKDALHRANEIGMTLEKENQELKSEIERLQNNLRSWKDIARRETGYVSIARTEAAKKFAERLKSKLFIDDDNFNPVVTENEINSVLKEMVGENR